MWLDRCSGHTHKKAVNSSKSFKSTNVYWYSYFSDKIKKTFEHRIKLKLSKTLETNGWNICLIKAKKYNLNRVKHDSTEQLSIKYTIHNVRIIVFAVLTKLLQHFQTLKVFQYFMEI